MTKPTITVVLIEDEKQIRRFVRDELEQHGMTVFEAATGREGLAAAATRQPDMLIVDLGLPDMDGLALIRDVREWAEMPLIVLSARSREAEKVAALDAGADDYLSKPFGSAELLARMHALLRRHRRGTQTNATIVQIGSALTVDLPSRTVLRAGQHVHLTPVEFRLLAMLVRHAGSVLTHRQLLNEVWGPSHIEDSHYLRIYMANLRQKLESDPTQPLHFVTETGVGYRLAGAE